MIYTYGYLIGSLALLLVWLALYFWRKDLRSEMLIISLIFGIGGLIVDPLYSDWWFPDTITGSLPGIESFLFGFSVAGIASVCYIELLGKKLRSRRNVEVYKKYSFWLIPLSIGAIFLFSLYVLKLNSFYASFPAFLIPLGFILFKRPDLAKDSLLSGVLLTIISLIFYLIPEYIFPGWINYTWNFELISGILVLGAPIEDLIWFFLTGLTIGPMYEFWKGARIVEKK